MPAPHQGKWRLPCLLLLKGLNVLCSKEPLKAISASVSYSPWRNPPLITDDLFPIDSAILPLETQKAGL